MEGRAEGLQEGRAEGLKEGLSKGLEEGAKTKARETATRMKQKGFPTEDICELTGLSADEIQTL